MLIVYGYEFLILAAQTGLSQHPQDGSPLFL